MNTVGAGDESVRKLRSSASITEPATSRGCQRSARLNSVGAITRSRFEGSILSLEPYFIDA
jgi:hypothetical protein